MDIAVHVVSGLGQGIACLLVCQGHRILVQSFFRYTEDLRITEFGILFGEVFQIGFDLIVAIVMIVLECCFHWYLL